MNDRELPSGLPSLAGSTNDRGPNANYGKGVHAKNMREVGGGGNV